ncbi:MAG: hypothetical protein ACK559_29070, partial [bacterium]
MVRLQVRGGEGHRTIRRAVRPYHRPRSRASGAPAGCWPARRGGARSRRWPGRSGRCRGTRGPRGPRGTASRCSDGPAGGRRSAPSAAGRTRSAAGRPARVASAAGGRGRASLAHLRAGDQRRRLVDQRVGLGTGQVAVAHQPGGDGAELLEGVGGVAHVDPLHVARGADVAADHADGEVAVDVGGLEDLGRIVREAHRRARGTVGADGEGEAADVVDDVEVEHDGLRGRRMGVV